MTAHPISELIIGKSDATAALREQVLRLAPSGLSVLVEGPTGTGKELVARALHSFSGRRGRLVATNVCAVNESVFENEFFGHKKGGYTGALRDADGYLLEANGGTVFLDEVSGLSLPLQAKLLRAIETGEFRPVGASADASSEFRVVSATNESLYRLSQAGRFRSDLLHRIGAVAVRTTALSERREDIHELITHFALALRRSASDFTGSAISILEEQSWPGNVRELRQFVILAMELHPGSVTASAVRQLREVTAFRAPVATEACGVRSKLVSVLREHGGRKADAARSLGVHVATFYRQLKKAGITGRTTMT